MSRKSGIVLPIFSLPGKYGIGTLGKSAYEFADFLKKSGQYYWQILPIGHTENGSPYEVISAIAGNPYLIDIDLLIKDGLLTKEEVDEKDFGNNEVAIDYKKLYKAKKEVLRLAYQKIDKDLEKRIAIFRDENKHWLEDYAFYNALNLYFGTTSWREWERPLLLRDEQVMEQYKEMLRDEIHYWCFVQYIFFKQWTNLKSYVNKLGCKIIGDIPFYVSMNSVDVWVNHRLFKMDDDRNPLAVAGCPPDQFSDDGQYWGYPVYDWDENEQTDFWWWTSRIKENHRLYDIIRLDHFIGFTRYFEIPASDTTARNGKWVKGPGIKFFDCIKEKLGDVNIVVEDLGELGEDVVNLRKEVGFKGMKVPMFAFGKKQLLEYMPYNYERDCFVYSSLHDTDTVLGWMSSAPKEEVDRVIKYLHLDEAEGLSWGVIRGCFSSVGDVAISQMQDILELGSEARMNIPPFLPNNWLWRMKQGVLTEQLADRLYELTKRYGRLPTDDNKVIRKKFYY